MWNIELEPEVERWLDQLDVKEFGTVAFNIDRLAENGPSLRMPHSGALGGGLYELRFFMVDIAQRVTYFFPGDRRIVLLTEFRKQRTNERIEIERARLAMIRCIREQHSAEEERQ